MNKIARQVEAAYNNFAKALNELAPELMEKSPEVAEEIYDCMMRIYGLIGALGANDKEGER